MVLPIKSRIGAGMVFPQTSHGLVHGVQGARAWMNRFGGSCRSGWKSCLSVRLRLGLVEVALELGKPHGSHAMNATWGVKEVGRVPKVDAFPNMIETTSTRLQQWGSTFFSSRRKVASCCGLNHQIRPMRKSCPTRNVKTNAIGLML